ncbi:LOW QUALITY PROTEIN: hypothetical protein NC651_025188 [Populus alba x Populus x berolinensis]|nr:LOW QUALITY PROTEIN: hypothetical protein NC651_025188 [Populus alba x Populus x berolinensis]
MAMFLDSRCTHHSKKSRQASLRDKMEVIKSIFADRHCSFFLVVLLLASTMSLAIAEIHHHDFVVQATKVKRLCKTHNSITVNGMFPGPTLQVKNGDTLVLSTKPDTTSPFTGEWWDANPIDVVREATRTGAAPNISDAYTINGQPGDLYNCSSEAYNDTATVTAFSGSLRNPRKVDVPTDIDENLFFTIGLGLNNCPKNARASRCQGPNGTRFTASMNNVSFVFPSNIALLQASQLKVPGIYTTDFPAQPPVKRVANALSLGCSHHMGFGHGFLGRGRDWGITECRASSSRSADINVWSLAISSGSSAFQKDSSLAKVIGDDIKGNMSSTPGT